MVMIARSCKWISAIRHHIVVFNLLKLTCFLSWILLPAIWWHLEHFHSPSSLNRVGQSLQERTQPSVTHISNIIYIYKLQVIKLLGRIWIVNTQEVEKLGLYNHRINPQNHSLTNCIPPHLPINSSKPLLFTYYSLYYRYGKTSLPHRGMMIMNFALYTSCLIRCMVSSRAVESGTRYGGRFLFMLLWRLSLSCDTSAW